MQSGCHSPIESRKSLPRFQEIDRRREIEADWFCCKPFFMAFTLI